MSGKVGGRDTVSREKVGREKVVNPPGFLATQDLKDRGWTAALIARFLGEHDQTRPNGLKMGRRRLPPVKLYAEERVLEAERRDDFLAAQARAADARERAERARQTRAERREALLVAAARSYRPVVQPLPVRKGARRKAREPYLPDLEAQQRWLEQQLPKVSRADSQRLRALMLEQLDAALSSIYDWFAPPLVPAAAQQAQASGQPAAPTHDPGSARPSDWRTWDWDDPGY